MRKKLSVGIIGCGEITAEVAREIRDTPNVKIGIFIRSRG